MRAPVKRTGSETKAEVQRVALALFTTKGFAATSLREIAEALGISKAALYYHFTSKDDIVRSIVADRIAEVAELLSWARSQETGPDLLERTVLRWVDATAVDKLHGIRFANANPNILRDLGAKAGIKEGLAAVAEFLAGKDADPKRQLMVRLALFSLNSAVMAAMGTPRTDEEIVAAAREMSLALLSRLRER
jgi:AcrR family transcriptional regulator